MTMTYHKPPECFVSDEITHRQIVHFNNRVNSAGWQAARTEARETLLAIISWLVMVDGIRHTTDFMQLVTDRMVDEVIKDEAA